MTVSPAISTISHPETAGVPYITTDYFINAPTGVATSNLVPLGSAPQQTAALASVILRASSWIDGQCHQVLGATIDTELVQARVQPRDGSVRLYPRCFPIRSVTAVSLGYDPTQLTALTDLSVVAIQNRRFTVMQPNLPFASSAGPLQLGPSFGSWSSLWARYSYVNGYPVTTLSAQFAAGVSSLTVVNALGVLPGQPLDISDLGYSETVFVQSVPGNTITLTAPTQYAHSAGVSVSGLPELVRQAALLATSGLIRQRGTGAVIMGSLGAAPSKVATAEAGGIDDLSQAASMLIAGDFVAAVDVPGLL